MSVHVKRCLDYIHSMLPCVLVSLLDKLQNSPVTTVTIRIPTNQHIEIHKPKPGGGKYGGRGGYYRQRFQEELDLCRPNIDEEKLYEIYRKLIEEFKLR
jgi:hypothetical protein